MLLDRRYRRRGPKVTSHPFATKLLDRSTYRSSAMIVAEFRFGVN
jgi:hypothetical protein